VPSPPTPLPRQTPDGPIVFAGRFARSKGVELLAALIPRVLARRRCRFILAGGHGDAASSRVISDIARRFPGDCSIVGWLERDALDRLFARASLVLVPSCYEPFGLVALEGMRVGAPVLAAAVGGLAEIVTEESGGRLVQSRDPERWCNQILEIMSTPSLTKKWRERGPQYVATRFDSVRLAKQLWDVAYRQGIATHRGTAERAGVRT
jgi:glycogen synthase